MEINKSDITKNNILNDVILKKTQSISLSGVKNKPIFLNNMLLILRKLIEEEKTDTEKNATDLSQIIKNPSIALSITKTTFNLSTAYGYKATTWTNKLSEKKNIDAIMKKIDVLINYIYLLIITDPNTSTTDPNTSTTDPNTSTTDPNTSIFNNVFLPLVNYAYDVCTNKDLDYIVQKETKNPWVFGGNKTRKLKTIAISHSMRVRKQHTIKRRIHNNRRRRITHRRRI